MRAKHALAYYMHYFERFIVHDKALKMAETQRENLKQTIAHFHEKESSVEVIELEFLFDGLQQVSECRRTLKWTYVYGYYLSDKAGPKKALFEFLQRNLEEHTDMLHELIERDLMGLFKPSDDLDGAREPLRKGKFNDFRSYVTNYSRVTRDFRKKILEDLTDESKGLLVGPDAEMTVL
jgi:ariadne-1